ncbi:MAG TPA: hypothetical protein VFV94_08930 [Polyangiaceae bacterium]|nr:hypothetical protein [Polyangiaceae bacterium]
MILMRTSIVSLGALLTLLSTASCSGSDEDAPAGTGGGAGSSASGGSSGSSGSKSAGGSSGTKASGGSSGSAKGGSSGSSGKGGAMNDGGTSGSSGGSGNAGAGGSSGVSGASGSSGSGSIDNPLTHPDDGPPAGNPDGRADVPAEAGPADSSTPDHVVGTGTKESCTAQDFIEAVAAGGVITFDCGDEPVTITLTEPAKVFNDASDKVVIDGGGKVSLSGGGTTRILYMNTCDEAQHWTTSHCDNQPYPELTVQNITFIDGNAKSYGIDSDGGGGAIYASGGRFKLVNTRFFNNVCADTGPDVGGAVRVFQQSDNKPVYVVNSTFGGADGFGNTCSNGGGISSIGVSWSIYNSVFSYNHAIGNGGNPADSGTPGGGSGGAIYNDGNSLTLSIYGSLIEHNDVKAYGSGIFFVCNDHVGTIRIHDSTVRDNTGGGWNALPGISMHDEMTRDIVNSTIE